MYKKSAEVTPKDKHSELHLAYLGNETLWVKVVNYLCDTWTEKQRVSVYIMKSML